MAQIDGAGQQDTDNQNAETPQAALAQRQVPRGGQPQGGSDVPIHQNSDPVSDESEILRSCQPLTGKRRVPWIGVLVRVFALGNARGFAVLPSNLRHEGIQGARANVCNPAAVLGMLLYAL